jgi:putative ABC transport system substrate-binding protein
MSLAKMYQSNFAKRRDITINCLRWALELAERQVDVIVTLGSAPATLAAKAATTSIPIVFSTAGNPLQLKLVASLSHPGGNITGVTTLNVEIGAKRVELLHEVVPTATSIALLVNPTSPDITGTEIRDAQAAAHSLGLKLDILHASTERDFDTVFADLTQLRPNALVIGTDAFFNGHGEQLGALALHSAIPAIYQYRPFATAGGLISYGSSLSETYRVAGTYTGRILNGEKPADLPVQQSGKVEMIINLKAAKALGLTIPLSLLGRADEVIE